MLPREAPDRERSARPAARSLTALVGTLALVAALALGIAGCGEDDEPPGREAETELEVSVDPDGRGGEEALEASLECPDGDDRGACAAIGELPKDPAAPVPPDAVCTEIYGGPDVATIEGTLEGKPISAELTRGNGCEIERFERFAPLLRALFPGYRPGEALKP